MPCDTVKIRRGKRTDFPALATLVSTADSVAAAPKSQARYWRRLASDPTHDFYVAEQAGTIHGVMLVSYVCSLTHQGWHAILDIVTSVSSARDVGCRLLEFAKARARQRGCQQLFLCCGSQEHATHPQLITQGGFLPVGEVLSCGL